jgi:hypothetical protein
LGIQFCGSCPQRIFHAKKYYDDGFDLNKVLRAHACVRSPRGSLDWWGVSDGSQWDCIFEIKGAKDWAEYDLIKDGVPNRECAESGRNTRRRSHKAVQLAWAVLISPRSSTASWRPGSSRDARRG